jgi:kynurenine formamidase
MKARINHNGKPFEVDLSSPLHISFPIHNGENQLRAWWVDAVKMEPVHSGSTIYSVEEGAPVNFRNVFFNPHGHGTHTECVGHITEQVHSVDQVLRDAHFFATLISIEPERWRSENGEEDRVISEAQLREALNDNANEALIIRTLPNGVSKMTADYSGSNPPYMETSACAYLRDIGIKHLLLDLPSVDREDDDGALAGHKAFWGQPGKPDLVRTITELIYVNGNILDGDYLLEIQIAPFANDASPSRPILYELNEC